MGRQYLDLPIAPPDVAFGLMAKYDTDAHPNKVSLIAGAYRDENGSPWVLPSVERVSAYPPEHLQRIQPYIYISTAQCTVP